jgi:membrane-bound metal-dependent hydrolase YbcI (DUF457 family)
VPVTPFHFGPGLLLKAAAPRRVSLTAFVLANVAIDVESVVNLVAGRMPVHATLHTFAVAPVLGLALGAVVHAPARAGRWKNPETALAPALTGGWLGGFTHIVLDGVMHRDIRPFWPFTDANPLLRVVDLPALHLVCVATGALGLAWLAARSARRAA